MSCVARHAVIGMELIKKYCTTDTGSLQFTLRDLVVNREFDAPDKSKAGASTDLFGKEAVSRGRCQSVTWPVQGVKFYIDLDAVVQCCVILGNDDRRPDTVSST